MNRHEIIRTTGEFRLIEVFENNYLTSPSSLHWEKRSGQDRSGCTRWVDCTQGDFDVLMGQLASEFREIEQQKRRAK